MPAAAVKEQKSADTGGKRQVSALMAERVGFEPTCPCGQLDFEFYRHLLITWFLLSVSVSFVRPQTRMKSGLFEKIARKY